MLKRWRQQQRRWRAHTKITQIGSGRNGCSGDGNGGCNGNRDNNQLKGKMVVAVMAGTTRDIFTLADVWAGGTGYGVIFFSLNKCVCFVFCVTSFPFVISP
jgi:hypothetical protein